MNAIQILEEQHREAEALFAAFELAQELEERIRIFNDLADALLAHAKVEEEVFYRAVKVGPLEDIVHDAYQDHLQVKRLMADLLSGMELEEEEFVSKVLAIKASVESHVNEEETDIFPRVRELFGQDELEALAVEMENVYGELMSEGEPRARIPLEAQKSAE